MLDWDNPNERYYEHGIDRGVLYIPWPATDPIPWNGITGFEEGSEQGSTTVLYKDGVVYLADVEASDFAGKLTALFYPDEFGICLGIPMVADGLFVDNQKPRRFGLSYRSLVGSGLEGDRFGYQIHLVYNAIASIGSRSRRTINASPEPVEFTFDIVAAPVQMTGYRPSAHYVIDTRFLSQTTIDGLEVLLYGDGVTPGAMPTPDQLYDLLNFGDAIIVTDHQDGYLTIQGSYSNVHLLDSDTGYVNNINAIDIGGGVIEISDGGNTTIVLD